MFLQMGLDRANQIDPVQEIRPRAQMAWPLFAPMSRPSTFSPSPSWPGEECTKTPTAYLPLRFMRD
jgi:hypothetical protein